PEIRMGKRPHLRFRPREEREDRLMHWGKSSEDLTGLNPAMDAHWPTFVCRIQSGRAARSILFEFTRAMERDAHSHQRPFLFATDDAYLAVEHGGALAHAQQIQRPPAGGLAPANGASIVL